MKHRRWKKGTWMKLKSREVLRAFVGDPAKDPSKKMSGRRLARYAEVHPSFIDHLLAGRKSSCEPRTAELIAEGLGVPLEVLFAPNEPTGKRVLTKQESLPVMRTKVPA